MAGKTQTAGPMKALMVRLPPKMQEDLEKAAKKRGLGKRGLAEEIRRRLEASLVADKSPATTRSVLDAMNGVARTLEVDGQWFEDRLLFEAFKAAALHIIEHFQPPGEPVAMEGRHVLFVDDPEGNGRMLARLELREIKVAKP